MGASVAAWGHGVCSAVPLATSAAWGPVVVVWERNPSAPAPTGAVEPGVRWPSDGSARSLEVVPYTHTR